MENEKNKDIRQATHENVDKVLDKVENISSGTKEKVVQIKEKAIETRENVDESIRQNPEKSVLIAAGAGAVIGAVVAAAIMKKDPVAVEEETLPT